MIKIKKNYLAAILLVLLSAIAVICGIVCTQSLNASAATYYTDSGKYKLNVSAVMQMTSNATAYDYNAYLYGNSTSSTITTVSSGVVFNFAPTKFEIVIPAGSSSNYHKYYGRVYDVSLSGPVAFSSSSVNEGSTSSETTVSFTLSGLTDGTYTLSFTKDEYYYSSTSIGGTSSGYRGETTCNFTFVVDKSAPTISGASTSATGYYTNTAFTVTASDSVSGVEKLYYKSPTASSYSYTTSSSKKYSSGMTNGLYRFYTTDNAGNTSATYYVYYDNTAPTLTVSGASFGSSTGTGFTVTASDTSGSAVSLYYRKGGSGDFAKISSTSYTVNSTAGDDSYYFYAVDAAGNTSSTYTVTLSTAAASGEFVKSDTDNSVFFYWTNSLWTATLDGSNYTSGTWITEEGEHTIVLTSPTTGSETYSYTIEHCYEKYWVVAATCSSQGYTIYKCTQCGDTYYDDYTEKLSHTYTTSLTAATCTEQGYTKYTCTQCGYSYLSDYISANGHNYVDTVVNSTCTEQGYTHHICVTCGYSYESDYTETIPHSYQSNYTAPTCTQGGYMEYVCTNCGDTYSETVTLPTDHTYTITVIKSATCTDTGLRHYCCDNCGYEYDVEIPAIGHNYVIIDVENDDGNTIRTYQCDDCGESYTEELGNQAEYVASYIEYLFDGYSNYIWWLLLATVGVWSIVMGVFFAIATKNEDKQKARKMVVNYLIGLVVIAVILVAAPYLAYGIAVWVT